VAIEFFRGPHFGGFRETMPQPLIVDMAIHHFDLMRYLLDAEPVSVYAQSFNPSWSWFGGDASASVLFNLRTKAGRPVHVNYAGSWCANGPDTPWNGHWRIVCAHGTLTVRDDVIQLQRAGNQPPESIPVPKLERAGQDYLLHAFAASIQSGRPPETSGEDNLNSIGMVFQAVASAEQGQALTF
ncbi:MAG TPA: Gfo/Idh/MocA family oxidoreductase, partial [Limnochordia bacterium]|nr:Gfo/Idh/MocA family oxidoreductase [Limnochordia bacterium]